MRPGTPFLSLCGLLLLAACGGDLGTPAESDRLDASSAGCEPCDAGSGDAGSDDAGPGDAGFSDAGSTDAGSGDDGADGGSELALRIYVASDGNDGRSGVSPEEAVLTLQRVNELLTHLQPQRDVEVRIAPGTYFGQQVNWTYTMAEHAIVFMPADGGTTRPVFDGCSASGDCSVGTWFRMRKAEGTPTNLEFRYLRVQRYSTAISFEGDRNRTDGSNGGNTIYGCYFDRIGNVFDSSLAPSTAAVRFVNSDDNLVANSHFVEVVNTVSGGLIHALYIAHLSERNRVERNRFVTSSGDPVRLRDGSNDNVIRDNTFINVGTAGYSDWYCDHDTRTDCTKTTPECPSWDNQFRDNVLDGSWTCDPLTTFVYYQDDTATGCSPPTAASRRLRTSGNQQTNTPCSGL